MFVPVIISVPNLFPVAAPLLETHVVTELVVAHLDIKGAKLFCAVIVGSCCCCITSSTSPTAACIKRFCYHDTGVRATSIGFHAGLDSVEQSSEGHWVLA